MAYGNSLYWALGAIRILQKTISSLQTQMSELKDSKPYVEFGRSDHSLAPKVRISLYDALRDASARAFDPATSVVCTTSPDNEYAKYDDIIGVDDGPSVVACATSPDRESVKTADESGHVARSSNENKGHPSVCETGTLIDSVATENYKSPCTKEAKSHGNFGTQDAKSHTYCGTHIAESRTIPYTMDAKGGHMKKNSCTDEAKSHEECFTQDAESCAIPFTKDAKSQEKCCFKDAKSDNNSCTDATSPRVSGTEDAKSHIISCTFDAKSHTNSGTGDVKSHGICCFETAVPSQDELTTVQVCQDLRRGGFCKEEVVINLVLNRSYTRDTFTKAFDDLQAYFDSRLMQLTRFIKARFGIPGSDWLEVKQEVVRFIYGQVCKQDRFTVAQLLAFYHAQRSCPKRKGKPLTKLRDHSKSVSRRTSGNRSIQQVGLQRNSSGKYATT